VYQFTRTAPATFKKICGLTLANFDTVFSRVEKAIIDIKLIPGINCPVELKQKKW